MSRKLYPEALRLPDVRSSRPAPRSAPASGKSKDTHWRYTGRELESMAFARRYHGWILDVFRPFLGKHIVEVGAGSGSFSKLLLETGPERLDAIEPSVNLFPLLAKRLDSVDSRQIGYAHKGTLSDTAESIRRAGRPDSVIYVNVLEHIEDDDRELHAMHSLLQPGGHALIFAPAHRWLMGSMDHQLGHHRRYTKASLIEKCRAAGFSIRLSSYFDMLGIIPWWVQYCVLHSKTMEPAAVRFYDRYVIPVSQFLQRAIHPPLGRNIILVAEKAK
jgi:2-polyprenyl-3-methyl-5-hydroxy-6-metoxy-1,4-benzoquinol methylase